MKLLKNLTLSLLSLLLFLSLSLFGLAFMLKNTLLNPDFVTSEVDRLDMSSLAAEIISEQGTNKEIEAALVQTTIKLEPLVKRQVDIAIYSTYDYLLGKKQSPELALTLKRTILSSGFITSMVNELDTASLIGAYLRPQLIGNTPPEMGSLAKSIDKHLDEVLIELEPWLKKQVAIAADPMMTYLLGESQGFSVEISLDPVKESLRDKLWASFRESLPPELAMIPQSSQKTRLIIIKPGAWKPYNNTPVVVNETVVFESMIQNEGAELGGRTGGALGSTELPGGSYQAGDVLHWAILARTTTPPVTLFISVQTNKGDENNLTTSLSIPGTRSWVVSTPVVIDQFKPTIYFGTPNINKRIEVQTVALGDPDSIGKLVYGDFVQALPSTFVINQSVLGTRIPSQIAEALAGAEKGLRQARQYIGYIELGYKALFGFMVLLILGIILLNRRVRDATRSLGITFLTYGAFEYGGIFVAKYFSGRQLSLPGIPASLQVWLPQFLDNLLSPLEMFSLGLLIGGLALIIVSFVYKPSQTSL